MMQLKTYQETCVHALRDFFSALKDDFGKRRAPELAWREVTGNKNDYTTLMDGLGNSVPFVCVQVPTGGGKTLLATHAVDIAKEFVTRSNTGFVLWLVPTNQIYTQTLNALRIKDHPYRQALDRASAGKTKILERDEKFTPSDVEENLVVMLMMLQAGNRKSKDYLKMYQSSGFSKFFPPEDRLDLHEARLKQYPNLDYDTFLSNRQIKDSLGNTIRLLRPVVILDEGHKAKSELAIKTLAGFNPSAIIEFTATPLPKLSNVIVKITGKQLLAEEMVKLPINVENVQHAEWRDTLLAARTRLDRLALEAKELYSKTGRYIRPICLIQVERVGEKEQGKDFIHAYQVRDELRKLDIAENEIVIHTGEQKGLSVFTDANGLLTKNNPVRYIITKEALKEGWDCSFAYVLCLLNNPKSTTGATQLVGRIMRQPEARKTGMPALDQSYVVSYRRNGVIQEIKDGFEREGITGMDSYIQRAQFGEKKEIVKTEYQIRETYERAMKHFIMPMFVTMAKTPRLVDYQADIDSRIDWSSISIEKFLSGFQLTAIPLESTNDTLTLSDDEDLIYVNQSGEIVNTFQEATPEYLASDINHIVQNPWQAYELSKKVLDSLRKKHVDGEAGEDLLRYNLFKISDELRTMLYNERERMAKEIFLERLRKEEIRFVFFTNSWRPPTPKFAPSEESPFSHPQPAPPVVKHRGDVMQQSLFDPGSIMASEFDTKLERDVALWLDSQEKLFFWYRNSAGRGGYFLQGWRPNKIYPDFITTSRRSDGTYGIDKVYVIETKGDHLAEQKEESRHDRTGYTKFLFERCNDAKPKHLSELGFEMNSQPPTFKLVYQEEWEQELRRLFAAA